MTFSPIVTQSLGRYDIELIKFDDITKSRISPQIVIPAKAGIQRTCNYFKELDFGSSPE